jgi:hypothetical protein
VETSSFPPVGISSCTLVFSTGGNSNLLIFPPVGIYTFSTCGNLFNLLIFPPVGIYSIYSFSHQWEFTHFSHWWEFSHFSTGVPNQIIFLPVGIYTFSHRWESPNFSTGGNSHIIPSVGIYTMLFKFGFENGKLNCKKNVIWI